MKKDMGEKGVIKLVLMVAVFVGFVYLLISFGTPYYRYYTLGSLTRDMLKMQQTAVDEIKQKILENAVELKINLKESDVEVIMTEKQLIKVRARWTDTVDLGGYYQKKFTFDLYEEY